MLSKHSKGVVVPRCGVIQNQTGNHPGKWVRTGMVIVPPTPPIYHEDGCNWTGHIEELDGSHRGIGNEECDIGGPHASDRYKIF